MSRECVLLFDFGKTDTHFKISYIVVACFCLYVQFKFNTICSVFMFTVALVWRKSRYLINIGPCSSFRIIERNIYVQ